MNKCKQCGKEIFMAKHKTKKILIALDYMAPVMRVYGMFDDLTNSYCETVGGHFVPHSEVCIAVNNNKSKLDCSVRGGNGNKSRDMQA